MAQSPRRPPSRRAPDGTLFTVRLALASFEDTQALGRRLAPLLEPGDLLALRGSLGAGKTALARAIIQVVLPEEEVPSPTFTLAQSYEGPALALTHMDLYRLESPDGLWELGWDHAVSLGAVLVEWPERLPAAALLPNRLDIHLERDAEGEGRTVLLKGFGTWASRLQRLEGDW